MKRFFVFAIVIALLSLSSYAGAAIAVQKDGVYVADAAKINAGRAINATFDNYDTVTFLANGHKEGTTTNVSTESHLTSAALAYGYIRHTQDSPGDKTVDIEDGSPGQMVTISLTAKAAGNYIISKTCTATPVTCTGWSLLTFDTAGDSITLLYLDSTTGWIVVGNNGVSITQ